jgi:hypothetical protein
MNEKDLLAEYGKLTFELKIIQSKLAEIERRLIESSNNGTLAQDMDKK